MRESTKWVEGEIEGCSITPFVTFEDERGWLGEIFRHDELPDQLHPAMGYLSLTHAGVSRGPHEHADQSDLFLFFSGTFRVYLWDTRPDSYTRNTRHIVDVGELNPVVVIVPPRVVHAYRNVGERDAYVINCPNRLYRGRGKSEPVDEIRYENAGYSGFELD